MRNMQTSWLSLILLVLAATSCGFPRLPELGDGDSDDAGSQPLPSPHETFDVNGDGYADFLVAANGGDSLGAVHLYLGGASISASSWNGGVGRIDVTSPEGVVATKFGASVAKVGDVNRDGYADFVVGARYGSSGKGTAYLFLGSARPIAGDWNGPSAPKRFLLTNPDSTDTYWQDVSGAGDVNDDGYDDFLVGYLGFAGSPGVVHLYLGSGLPSSASWNEASTTQRIDLAAPDGVGSFFCRVARAGDVNRDGYGDFIVGAQGAGAAYLYLGSAAVTSGNWDRAGRLHVSSPVNQQAFGSSIAQAGDVNKDGYSDFLVSSFSSGSGEGAIRIYLGGPGPSQTAWNQVADNSRIDLTGPEGANSLIYVVNGAGDVNGDGYADFLVGAGYADSYAGAAYLYLGVATPTGGDWNGPLPARRIKLTSPDGGISAFGYPAVGVGDVNGDGYTDFLIGADLASQNLGAAHLYLGTPSGGDSEWNGSSPSRRIDLISPDGASAYYGGAGG